jgi:hypothetical protein
VTALLRVAARSPSVMTADPSVVTHQVSLSKLDRVRQIVVPVPKPFLTATATWVLTAQTHGDGSRLVCPDWTPGICRHQGGGTAPPGAMESSIVTADLPGRGGRLRSVIGVNALLPPSNLTALGRIATLSW